MGQQVRILGHLNLNFIDYACHIYNLLKNITKSRHCMLDQME